MMDRAFSAPDQARVETPALPATPATPADRVLALQRAAGNRAVAAMLQRAEAPGPATGGELAAYQAAMDEKRAFQALAPLQIRDHTPSTGIGLFDAQYDPKAGVLAVTVNCSFEFVDGTRSQLMTKSGRRLPQGPLPPDVDIEKDPVHLVQVADRWTPEEQRRWRYKFMAQAEAWWSEQFTFWSTRDWWEDVRALVTIDFKEADPQKVPRSSRFNVRVHKESNQESQVMTESRSAFMSERDLDSNLTARGTSHITGAHEAGHFLGLGDEYPIKDTDEVKHSALVKAEFGHEVRRGTTDPDSMMSGGILVLPEHGVTMLEVLRLLTAKAPMPVGWSHQPRPPRPVPEGAQP